MLFFAIYGTLAGLATLWVLIEAEVYCWQCAALSATATALSLGGLVGALR